MKFPIWILVKKKLDDLEQVYNPAIWEILGKLTFFNEKYTKIELLIWGGILQCSWLIQINWMCNLNLDAYIS